MINLCERKQIRHYHIITIINMDLPSYCYDFLEHRADHWIESKALVVAELPTSSKEFDNDIKSLGINFVCTSDNELDLILDFIKNKEKLKSNSRFY